MISFVMDRILAKISLCSILTVLPPRRMLPKRFLGSQRAHIGQIVRDVLLSTSVPYVLMLHASLIHISPIGSRSFTAFLSTSVSMLRFVICSFIWLIHLLEDLVVLRL